VALSSLVSLLARSLGRLGVFVISGLSMNLSASAWALPAQVGLGARSARGLFRSAQNGGARLRHAGINRLATGHRRPTAFFDNLPSAARTVPSRQVFIMLAQEPEPCGSFSSGGRDRGPGCAGLEPSMKPARVGKGNLR
jgi:hypothetical protein